jgi:hypothetical protein
MVRTTMRAEFIRLLFTLRRMLELYVGGSFSSKHDQGVKA